MAQITLDGLPPDLIAEITSQIDLASAFALKYTSKQLFSTIPATSSALKLLSSAAYSGSIPLIEWLHSMGCTADNVNKRVNRIRKIRVKDYPDTVVCIEAVRGRQLSMLKWLYRNNFSITTDIFKHAACIGADDICEWILPKLRYVSFSCLKTAAAAGNIRALEWIVVQCPVLYRRPIPAFICAAAAGQTKSLEWLSSMGKNTDSRQIIRAAAFNGHLETVQWLLRNGHSARGAYVGAIEGHQKHIIEWLNSAGYARPNDVWLAFYPCDAQSPDFVLNKYAL